MNFNDEELVNNMDSFALVNNMAFLSTSERKNVLNNSSVLNKLRSELLEDCNKGDIYRNFREVLDILDLDDIFKIFDYNIINNFYKELTISDFPNYKNDYNNGNYEVKLYYNKGDEWQIVGRLVSFGPYVRVKSPISVVKQIAQKVSEQLKVFEAGL